MKNKDDDFDLMFEN